MTTERLDAVIALLRIADPFDGWRTHKVVCEGDPQRSVRYQDLPIRYVAWTRLTREDGSA